ncbi:MAG: hypothetical protein V3V57_15845 [Spirochaetia bacterium]
MKVKIEGIEQQLKVEGKSSSRAIESTERPPRPGRRGKPSSRARLPKS